MVSGFPTPPGKTWAYPKHLMKQLDRAVDGYEIDVPLTKPSDMKGGETAYLEQVERLHSKCVQAGKYLLEQYHPDLFMMTLQGVDMVQHDFSRYMVEPNSEYTNVIKDWYIRLDEAVGEFRKHASSETYVLTLSDHGSVPIATSFHVNEFLKKQGILVLKEPSKTTGKKKKNRDLYTPLRNMLLKNMSPNTIRTLYRVTPDFIAHKLTLSAQHERTLTRLVNSIDWNHTQAFSTGGPQAAFYVNSQEYDHGLFKDPAKRMEFIQKLKILLDNLKHPLTGEKITAIFHHRENTFKGPFELEAPDLCVELFGRNEKIHINITLGQDHEWSFSPHLSSEHVREGFWSITGPEVPAENHLDANILDLAPTLETMLHLQVDRDTDGAVIVSLLGGSHKSEIPLVTVVR
jgi:predicted AlkP superfamily phosphohydrolase/phosphomutase